MWSDKLVHELLVSSFIPTVFGPYLIDTTVVYLVRKVHAYHLYSGVNTSPCAGEMSDP